MAAKLCCSMKNLQFKDIIKNNNLLAKEVSGEPYKVSILNNITTNQITPILEYALRTQNINVDCQIGNYDNIIQDSITHNKSNLVIVFWEACNIIEGLHYKINSFSAEDYKSLYEKVTNELQFLFQNLKHTDLVLINSFSSSAFTNNLASTNQFDRFCAELNQFLQTSLPNNFRIINIENIFKEISVTQSVDWRYFSMSKALYTVDFYKHYTAKVLPYVLSAQGKAKKALIFDCDNTLWKGILGEDGKENIIMDSQSKDGRFFQEVQYIAKELYQRGVIIGICSKNNPEDVEEILNSHPDMVLSNDFLTIKKVNWQDKASNLKEIAQDLNIGLDSLVFIDDSDFEINLIKSEIPEITCFQVPKKLVNYPFLIKEAANLFYQLNTTAEDSKKNEMYKTQALRESSKKQFTDMTSYLESLDIELKIYQDHKDLIPRMAQLTQKTNQFNLTTKRYTESHISDFVANDTHLVMAFEASDKFGNNGITGLSIIKINNDDQSAEIDSFLMSCRVLGRNIEYKFLNSILQNLAEKGINKVSSQYLKSAKNAQVKDFYEQFGFSKVLEEEDKKLYQATLSDLKLKPIPYIRVNYE